MLTPETQFVLELGSLLGLSTKHLTEYAPNATVVAIDHWRGSQEHQRNADLADVLDKLFEVFCVHLWDYRDRVIPMRTTTLQGMVELERLLVVSARPTSVPPSIVYIDAGHETHAVYADTMLAMMLWPNAHIVGDDGCWDSIKAAHVEIQRMTDRTLTNYGVCWEIPPKGTPRTWEKP